MRHEASGIILAGGAGRRMGCDKTSLDLGGSTSLEKVARTVSALCSDIVIAAGPHPAHQMHGLAPAWVADPPGASGPLAGLTAGLAAASHKTALVVACDMPFLNARLLSHLLELLDGCDAVVPMAGGRAQPLHAAYSRRCLAPAGALLRLGARSMRELLPRLRVRYLEESRCRELDPDGLSTFNMNTPRDYRFALACSTAAPPAA
jgi:molybdopterin-guanine dinucleotide biosynthesis protein A